MSAKKTSNALNAAVAAFELAMFQRAAPRAAESAANLEVLFGDNGSRAMSELMRSQDTAL